MTLHMIPILQFAKHYGAQPLLPWILPKRLLRQRQDIMTFAYDKVNKRLAQPLTREDFWQHVMHDKVVLSLEEMQSTGFVLLLAGSETVGSALSATLFYLLSSPEWYDKLVGEVRATYSCENEITHKTTSGLQLLNAVLEEALRLHPPAPSFTPRKVPAPGENIDGRWVPKQVRLPQ